MGRYVRVSDAVCGSVNKSDLGGRGLCVFHILITAHHQGEAGQEPEAEAVLLGGGVVAALVLHLGPPA